MDEEERKKFEQWYVDSSYPCEWSSYYLRNVIFKREDDGDWYVDEKVQSTWDGWQGKAQNP